MRAWWYDAQKHRVEEVDAEILHSRLKARNVPVAKNSDGGPLAPCGSFVWLDLAAPTRGELDFVAQQFSLDPQVLEDLLSREGRPKLHDYHGYLYLIFHQWTRAGGADFEIDLHEVDALVGHDWLVTAHPQPIASWHELAARWQRRPDWMGGGPGALLYELIDAVLDEYLPLLDEVNTQIEALEERLYAVGDNGDVADLPGQIFTLRRMLLQLRHVAGPMRDVANTLLRRDAEHGGHHFAAFQDLYDHATRITENLDTNREILGGALDAFLALQSNRVNAVMKRLTAYSIILLLPGLIAGIFGMNFEDLPGRNGFYLTLGGMAVLIVGLLVYFRKRDWM